MLTGMMREVREMYDMIRDCSDEMLRGMLRGAEFRYDEAIEQAAAAAERIDAYKRELVCRRAAAHIVSEMLA